MRTMSSVSRAKSSGNESDEPEVVEAALASIPKSDVHKGGLDGLMVDGSDSDDGFVRRANKPKVSKSKRPASGGRRGGSSSDRADEEDDDNGAAIPVSGRDSKRPQKSSSGAGPAGDSEILLVDDDSEAALSASSPQGRGRGNGSNKRRKDSIVILDSPEGVPASNGVRGPQMSAGGSRGTGRGSGSGRGGARGQRRAGAGVTGRPGIHGAGRGRMSGSARYSEPREEGMDACWEEELDEDGPEGFEVDVEEQEHSGSSGASLAEILRRYAGRASELTNSPYDNVIAFPSFAAGGAWREGQGGGAGSAADAGRSYRTGGSGAGVSHRVLRLTSAPAFTELQLADMRPAERVQALNAMGREFGPEDYELLSALDEQAKPCAHDVDQAIAMSRLATILPVRMPNRRQSKGQASSAGESSRSAAQAVVSLDSEGDEVQVFDDADGQGWIGASGSSAAMAGPAAINEECPICQEDMPAGSRVKILPACHHTFHPSCIEKWFDISKGKCPVCKADMMKYV